MSTDVRTERRTEPISGRRALAVAGGLLVAGLLLNVFWTLLHPSGDEDNHEVIFAKYANSDAWVAVHLGQFVGVLLALGGLLALSLAMRAGGTAPLEGRAVDGVSGQRCL